MLATVLVQLAGDTSPTPVPKHWPPARPCWHHVLLQAPCSQTL